MYESSAALFRLIQLQAPEMRSNRARRDYEAPEQTEASSGARLGGAGRG